MHHSSPKNSQFEVFQAYNLTFRLTHMVSKLSQKISHLTEDKPSRFHAKQISDDQVMSFQVSNTIGKVQKKNRILEFEIL